MTTLDVTTVPARVLRRPVKARTVLTWVCLGFVVLVYVASWVVPLPYDPESVDATAVLTGPSATHPFGTDANGADILSRVLAAGRVDLTLAVLGTVAAVVVGVVVGLLASRTGRLARGLMSVLDVLQSFPLVLFSVIVVSLSGNDLKAVVAAIVVIGAPTVVRLVRSEALTVRTLRYIEVAESVGVPPARITFRHVLPNVSGIICAQAAIMLGRALMIIATLAFIGVGVTAPTPSWGAMIRAGASVVATGNWWVAAFPGLAVVLVVLAVNLAADGVQEFLRGER